MSVCCVWVHVLKTGNHPARTKKAWGCRTSGAWGYSEAETEQLTLREELRTLPDRVEKRQQTGRAGMAGSQKAHLGPTEAG